jgi:hypothetical protein
VPQVRPGVPGPKTMGRPGFPVRCTGRDRVCGFRMKCAGATKLHRKSGVSPTIAFTESPQIGLWIQLDLLYCGENTRTRNLPGKTCPFRILLVQCRIAHLGI